MEEAERLIHEYDGKLMNTDEKSDKILEEANRKKTDMVKKASDKAIGSALRETSEHMKIRYHRGDN